MLTTSLLESHLSRCRTPAHLLQIQAQALVSGLPLRDPSASGRLVLFTSTSPSLPLAHSLHLLLHHTHTHTPNTFSWNCLLRAYLRRGLPHLCLPLYSSMLRRGLAADHFTYPLLAAACAARRAPVEGRQLHSHVLKVGLDAAVYVANTMMHMYSVCGVLGDARRVFDTSPVRDSVSWNTILAAYVQARDVEEAVRLFGRMPQRNVIAVNSMVALFGRSGLVEDARRLFDGAGHRDVVTWTAMISCYQQNGMPAEALEVFSEMYREGWPVDEALMVSVISASARSEAVRHGETCHSLVVKAGLVSRVNVQNALVHMYASCSDVTSARRLFNLGEHLDQFSWNSMIAGYLKNGLVDEAKVLFNVMPDKDNVSWSTMISGSARHNRPAEALALFSDMQAGGIEPDEVTLVSVLSACAAVPALEQGKWLHEYIARHGYSITVVLGTALIDMYMKCGCVESALEVFDAMQEKAASCWNAVIIGLAMNGLVMKSLDKFSEMEASTAAVPNEITFVGVLGACRHAGLVDEGRHFFQLMQQKYQIVPNIRHYGCMVDLLGRAGHVREAEELIKSIPMSPDVPTWGALLSACRNHGESEIGGRVGRKLVEQEPEHDGFHALLSNIYASERMWECVKNLRGSMKQRHVAKAPGFSAVESDIRS